MTVQRCPKCDGIGKPLYVKSNNGAVVLNFRCPYCSHTWTTQPTNERGVNPDSLHNGNR